MKYMTLVPAYGRDYTSGKAAKADFEANKDFTIMDISSRWDGKVANKEDLQKEAPITLNIRYKKLTQIAQVVLK